MTAQRHYKKQLRCPMCGGTSWRRADSHELCRTCDQGFTRAAPGPGAESATCRSVSGDYWYPDGSAWEVRNKQEVAKSICVDCPVRVECLAHAIDNSEPHGIWGGMTPKERRLLRGSA